MSNYETMQNSMQIRFLKYNQEFMIEKFHLDHDGDNLYIRFCGRMYRISRRSGKVTWSEDGFLNCIDAGYNEAMSIYDVFKGELPPVREILYS